jgi:hypothetical protein
MISKAAFFPMSGKIDTIEIARLKKAKFLIAMVGYFPHLEEKDIWRAAKELKTIVGMDTLLACAHPPEEHCLCRPPKPYLITTFMTTRNVSYDDSWFFASEYEYVGMGRAAGIKNVVFVRPEFGALKKAVDKALGGQAPTPAPPPK